MYYIYQGLSSGLVIKLFNRSNKSSRCCFNSLEEERVNTIMSKFAKDQLPIGRGTPHLIANKLGSLLFIVFVNI